MTDRSYILYYSQPRLARVEPHGVVWDKKEEHFTAKDDAEATKIMCEFLGKEPLVLRTGTHSRTCIRLVLKHPYTVVRECYPLKPTVTLYGGKDLPHKVRFSH